ncbi:MAG: hypothetical protein ACC656_09750, partial [Candidatus Heimdallarchaeota archaeon]
GEYNVDINKFGYLPYSFQILLDIPNTYISYFVPLIPEGAPMDFNIISPTNSDVVDGALVHVFFDATNSWDIEFIDVFVNDQYITTISFIPDTNFYVPIFVEGLNNITLMANWYSGQNAWASVIIESVNLIPYMLPEIGDYIDVRIIVNIDPILMIDFNFTVVDWVSPNEVLFELVYRQYNNTGTIELNTYYLVVNVLNGYVSDSDMWWLYQHFYFFSGLKSPSTANIGDSFPFWSWGEVLTITGTDIWNGMDVWVFNNVFDSFGFVLQENGLFVYDNENAGFIIAEVIDSSLFPSTTAPPSISDEQDFSYELGTIGHSISWTVNSEIPDYFIIYLNGVELELGTWSNGDILTVNVDNLSMGEYLYEILVFDTNGDFASDSVLLTVIDTTTPIVDGPISLTIEEGSINNNITWYVFDLDPLNYTVVRDSTLIEYGIWQNDVPIIINIDGL